MLTLKIAETTLSQFASTTHFYTPEKIRQKDHDIRVAFEKAGHDVKENSENDRKIKDAVRRAHHIGAKWKMSQLVQAGTDGAHDYRFIATLCDEVRGHREGLKLSLEKYILLDQALEKLRIKAHRTCAENISAKLDKSNLRYIEDYISDKAIQVCLHYEAIDEPVEVGSPRYNQLWDVTYHACNRSRLSEGATNTVFLKIEQWFKDRDDKREIDRALMVMEEISKNIPSAPSRQSFSARRLRDVAELYRMEKLPYRPRKKYELQRSIAINQFRQELQRLKKELLNYDFH